jgi:FlaG/FlaF family flagellin (archaellin)
MVSVFFQFLQPVPGTATDFKYPVGNTTRKLQQQLRYRSIFTALIALVEYPGDRVIINRPFYVSTSIMAYLSHY